MEDNILTNNSISQERFYIIGKVLHLRKGFTSQEKFYIIGKITVIEKTLHHRKCSASYIRKTLHHRKQSTSQGRLHIIGKALHHRTGSKTQDRLYIIGKVLHIGKAPYQREDSVYIIRKALYNRKGSRLWIPLHHKTQKKKKNIKSAIICIETNSLSI